MTVHQIVVMGVTGCGKTSAATAIAAIARAHLGEADDLHPQSNIDKMSRGIPLTDDDRTPWLTEISAWLGRTAATNTVGVITCSALKRSYRDILRSTGVPVYFVHLTGSRDEIADRMRGRAGHFMPTELIDSQFAILEHLDPDEDGIELDIRHTPDALAHMALEAVGLDTVSTERTR